MKSWLTNCLFLFLLFTEAQTYALEDLKSEVRISNLLPYLVHPPLVEPCLPDDFILGQKKDDSYFSEGYYWGNSMTLQTYFENPSKLNSCLIRAQISSNIKQIGLDRFSSDDKMNDLTAAGFTEIILNKDKWGIFPYRELHAKGPKGRHYYQLWVGLNEESGVTIYFQLIYPEYLSEPTQSQKKIWNDFIKKTSFLSLQDLIAFHQKESPKQKSKPFKCSVEKRRVDNRFAIFFDSKDNLDIHIQDIHEHNLLTGVFKKPYLELVIDMCDENHIESDTLEVEYRVVEDFTYYPTILYPEKFQISPDYFLFTAH